MRSLVTKFLLSLVLLGSSSAAPAPLNLGDQTASHEEGAVSQNLQGTGASTEDSLHIGKTTPGRSQGAGNVWVTDVTVPCQGCAPDEADVPHPVFTLDFRKEPAHSCAVAFTLNGTSIVLSKASPSEFFELGKHPAVYALQAVLDCPQTHEYTVSFLVKRFGSRQVVGRYGFDVRTTPDADEVSLSVSTFSPTGALSTYTLAPASSVHHSGTSDNHAVSPTRADEDQPSKSLCNHLSIHSLFSHVTAVFNDESFQHLKNKVQAVVANFKQHIPCAKHPSSPSLSLEAGNTSKLAIELQPVKDEDRLQNFAKTQTPLAIAFESSATAFVLLGVVFFLRTRCCSLRRRVERLADREERMKAREYRRAARREAWRKRWMVFKRTCTCCFGTYECEAEDEEKCALVTSAALDDDYIHSDFPRAQMQEQLTTHEIVAEMVRSRRRSFRDSLFFPYPIAPGGDTSRLPRSRASSLPSYDSDILPDYSSQPDLADVERRVRFAETFRRSGSPSGSTGSSRCTPDSSVPDISPRPSQETLRTTSTRVSRG